MLLETDLQLVDISQAVEVVEGYWFAWAAFHPETSVFAGPAPVSPGLDPARRAGQEPPP